MRRLIKCYAEGYEGNWEAVCIDFDIAVEGPTFEAVYSDLNKAIRMYLERVATLPAEERDHLLNRRVPLSLRLRFLASIIKAAIFTSRDGDHGRHGFVMPCPA